jgi:hypothetical protein
MQHAGDGRYGLLQEGGPGREPYSRSFNRAFMLRSQLFAERNHRLDGVSASAPIHKPSYSDSSIRCPTVSWDIAVIDSFKLGKQPSPIFQSRLHSTPRSPDLETQGRSVLCCCGSLLRNTQIRISV